MRRLLSPLLVLPVLVLLAWLGYQALFEGLGGSTLTVATVEGMVARDREGVRMPVLPGDTLGESDRIRAGAGGRAVLDAGAGTRMVLDAGADVQVVSVSGDEVRVSLEGGRLRATVRAEGPRVAVGVGADTLALRDADATLARDGDVVAVEVERGTVEATTAGRSARVDAGERLVVTATEAEIDAANESLLLTLADSPSMTRALDLEVRGRTFPGARVRVGQTGTWIEGRAEPTGQFSLRVPLREGANALSVESVDVLGRRAQQEVRVVRDTRAPVLGVEVQLR